MVAVLLIFSVVGIVSTVEYLRKKQPVSAAPLSQQAGGVLGLRTLPQPYDLSGSLPLVQEVTPAIEAAYYQQEVGYSPAHDLYIRSSDNESDPTDLELIL